jgi:hypothetical protein
MSDNKDDIKGIEFTNELNAHSKRFIKRQVKYGILDQRNPFSLLLSMLFLLPVKVGFKHIDMLNEITIFAKNLWKYENENEHNKIMFDETMDQLWLKFDKMVDILEKDIGQDTLRIAFLKKI